MKKRFMKLAAALLAFCLAVPPAGAATVNQKGDIMIRVGLASSSKHVPTGELEAAHLTNNSGYGSGYRFGFYDDNLNFVELARTEVGQDDVAVLKTVNLRYGRVPSLDKDTYSSSLSSGVQVGSYHVRIGGNYNSFAEASQKAASYENGFVAWIDGAYQVRVGNNTTEERAAATMEGLPGAVGVVGTSSYGLSVVVTGTDRILFQYDCGSSGRLAIQPDVTGAGETRTWFSGYKYRGGFQYHRRSGGNITVVNVLPLEDYLNGVICFEMGRNWPLEALKAQAMCARTYALKNLNKHKSDGFDICPSASCQVYYGMGSKPENGPSEVSMRAVAETAGMVVKYNGRLAETPYSSSFGGASEDAKYIWGTNTDTEYPYLRGVTDPYEADTDGINAHSSWTVSYTSAQLTQRLQSLGLGTGTSVDHLDLTYSTRGNVTQVTVHWANGKSNTISAGNIRSRFAVDSIRFTVNGGKADQPKPGEPSQDLYINGSKVTGGLDGKYVIAGSGSVSQVGSDPYAVTGSGSVSALDVGSGNGPGQTTGQPGSGTVTVSGDSYVFTGGGWGHQIGMSQYGAYAMAKRGFTFDEIIPFYFPGVQITHY
ncbi:MAG: SpoIID/LytB domain-containing protein [Lawsonibacter sp.]|nr:SpoIID/LytB domain-containing protein [Lawsonibacter sp.]